MGNQRRIQIWFKLPSGTCFRLLDVPSRAGKQREQSFMRFSHFWSGQIFCKSSFSHDALALLLLVLPEAWRQSCVKTLMEKATSLNAFDLQLQPKKIHVLILIDAQLLFAGLNVF